MSVPVFNLYDKLLDRVKYNTNIKFDRKKFLDFIKSTTDSTVHSTIYAIIKHHSNIQQNHVDSSIPYKGEFKKSNLKFNIDDLPSELQNILYEYRISYMEINDI
jgi:hypothetical protein